MSKYGLNANALKIIALITMTVDHVGYLIYPSVVWLRIIGRLAMPIYAFMIAEGCRHTRNIGKYLTTVAATAFFCQVVSFLATGSLYQCILVTFSLSIALIWLVRFAMKQNIFLNILLVLCSIFAVFFLTDMLPVLLPGTDYGVDYGIYGVLLPAAFYIGKKRWQQLLYGSLILLSYCGSVTWVQYFCFLSLPLLALYNGQKGKQNLKWFFYLYYPAHLGILYLLAPLLQT